MLGIDIGAYSIKAAVVKKSGKKVAIDQVITEVLPMEKRGGSIDVGTLRSLVGKVVKRVGKGQSKVALSIPTSSAILKTLQVDKGLSEDMLEGEIQLELVNFVPFPLDQVYIDFRRMGRSESDPDREDVFVAASRRDFVDKMADAVTSRTIKTKEVDVEAFAIGQVLEYVKGVGYEDAYAVVDIGYKTTTFCVFQRGEMIFSREQQVGGHNLTEAIAEVSGVELAEAEDTKHNAIDSVPRAVVQGYVESICEQLAMGLEFYSSSNDAPLKSIYVTGGGSLVPRLIDSLCERMPRYEFEVFPLEERIQIGRKTNGMDVETIVATAAVATGLSMRK